MQADPSTWSQWLRATVGSPVAGEVQVRLVNDQDSFQWPNLIATLLGGALAILASFVASWYQSKSARETQAEAQRVAAIERKYERFGQVYAFVSASPFQLVDLASMLYDNELEKLSSAMRDFMAVENNFLWAIRVEIPNVDGEVDRLGEAHERYFDRLLALSHLDVAARCTDENIAETDKLADDYTACARALCQGIMRAFKSLRDSSELSSVSGRRPTAAVPMSE